ncbi:MAG: complex I NDUFA9 subunit family protein [Proteobacteria bacterium]|nr:complex I NDUFA9 subunit family protein [Pseudomonadota bacterium]
MEKISERDSIVILGGTGFLGQHLVHQLAPLGARIRLVSRHGETESNKHLRICGAVGQIGFERVDITRQSSIEKVLYDATHIVNLLGTMHPTRKYSFALMHTDVPDLVARIAAHDKVKRLVHISALACDKAKTSQYALTKLLGEDRVKHEFLDATIIRPSVMFGHEDNFLNMFAKMSKYMPFLPLLGGGNTKMQPVYVEDVAKAIVMALTMEKGQVCGRTFEVVGPHVYTFADLMRYILKVTGRHRLLLPIPFWLAKMEATLLEKLPTPPLTRDQVELFKYHNILPPHHKNGLELLGITPTPMELIMTDHFKRQVYY